MQLSKISAGLITLLLITVYVYFPGLNSRFILDDFYNLQGLGDIQNQGLLYYVFGSGFAGPVGRPLSLLSFALQYQDWPLNPFAFKLFNLILHLLNGVLLFIFSLLLSRQVSLSMRQRYLFAFVVAGLWLLHPVHVNTVLYTVQRMTEIANQADGDTEILMPNDPSTFQIRHSFVIGYFVPDVHRDHCPATSIFLIHNALRASTKLC